MSDGEHRHRLPVSRPEPLVPMHTPRLLRRGIDALRHEEHVPLEVIELVAWGAAIFIMSTDWDREVRFANERDSEHSRSSWAQREIVLYEFDLSGSFVQRLALQLVHLKDEGYSRILSREPGPASPRSSFIHFFERLTTSEYSRPVRVDYLFDRSGKRLAVWSNEEFIDRYRLSDEPLAPSGSGVVPSFVTDIDLVRLDSDLWYHPPSGEYVEESRDEHVSVISAEKMVQHVQNPARYERSGHNYSTLIDSRVAVASKVSFPVSERFIAGQRFVPGWTATSVDRHEIWFMSHWTIANSSLWALDVQDDTVKLRKRTLPSPYWLIETGMITVPSNWPMSEFSKRGMFHDITVVDSDLDDYDYGEEDTELWNEHDFNEEIEEVVEKYDLTLETKKFFVSGEKAVIILTCHVPSVDQHTDDVMVLFDVTDRSFVPVKSVYPSAAVWESLYASWLAESSRLSSEALKSSYSVAVVAAANEHPAFGNLVHRDFRAGKLFSTNPDSPHRDKIIVTDILTDEVTWFPASVPQKAGSVNRHLAE